MYAVTILRTVRFLYHMFSYSILIFLGCIFYFNSLLTVAYI